jgi:hypothetical protein
MGKPRLLADLREEDKAAKAERHRVASRDDQLRVGESSGGAAPHGDGTRGGLDRKGLLHFAVGRGGKRSVGAGPEKSVLWCAFVFWSAVCKRIANGPPYPKCTKKRTGARRHPNAPPSR